MSVSLPSTSLGLESLKKWIDYWRKFKGKKVRIWFTAKDKKVLWQFYCKPWKEGQMPIPSSGTGIGTNLREVRICPCIDGIIRDIVDSPFGLILEKITRWHTVDVDLPTRDPPEAVVSEEIRGEISSMFIPMSEIARIDFLA